MLVPPYTKADLEKLRYLDPLTRYLKNQSFVYVAQVISNPPTQLEVQNISDALTSLQSKTGQTE